MENGDKLFRMNFIIQDNSLMTLDANLIRIVESIILDKGHNGLTLEQIKENILLEYELDFSEEEISKALIKKGRNIQKIEEKYHLKPEYRSKLEKRDDFTTQINKLIIQAIHECQLDVSAHRYQELIKKYLYYCFNSNKNSILSLINHTEVVDEKFSNDPEDIKLINTFLNWKNEEKDKLVTNVVSFGYIYCSLTVKKDDLLSNKLFRGKKFILDANIIFRLAGINNDWLTILLRFSGRTSDDYKAFCSFLELRTHQEESEIDVYSLLKNLAKEHYFSCYPIHNDCIKEYKKLFNESVSFEDTLNWIKKYTSLVDENKKTPVIFSSLSYVFNREMHEILIYSIIALENIYAPNDKGISYTLQKNISTVFPEITKDMIKNLYKMRSKFVHGDISVGNYQLFEETIDSTRDYNEPTKLAIALLLATIRKLIVNDAISIKFSETISFEYK